jgi:large exoprotein involved in heme utilization and adhesion
MKQRWFAQSLPVYLVRLVLGGGTIASLLCPVLAEAQIVSRDRVTFAGFDVDTDIVSSVSSGLIGSGQGGNISISTGTLTVSNFARLGADTSGNENVGNILLNARDSITVNSFGTVSSTVQRNGKGDGGNIQVVTGNLEVEDRAFLRTDTFGNGNAGNVMIAAKDHISLQGSDAVTSSNTLIASTIGFKEITNVRGTGGNVQISAGSLDVLNAQIATNTFGVGDAENVIIDVRDLALFGENDTLIASRVEDTGRGQGGNIRVVANTVAVLDGAALNASTLGTGDSGNITIEARDLILFDFSSAFSMARGITQDSTGKGGDIQITSNQVEICNQSLVNSSLSSAGDGGDIRISANTLRVGSDAEISASARRGLGSAGDVVIEVGDSFVVDNGTVTSRVESESLGQGGDIRIRADVLELMNNASLDASTSGGGSAGSILISARDQVSVDKSRIEVFSDSLSNAGNVTITASTVKLDRGTISAESATVDGGNINLNVGRLLVMRDGSLISATAGTAQGIYGLEFRPSSLSVLV